jgi:secreted PhoX family phosphatase
MDLYFIDANGRYTTTDTGRAVLAVNHESSADSYFMHPNGQTSNGVAGKKFSQFGEWDLGVRPELEVLKEINHHGVSIVEIVRTPAGWRIVPGSPLNRRITAQTPVRIDGPRAHRRYPLNDGYALECRWRHGAWHAEQLRPREDALGHLSGLRGELGFLFWHEWLRRLARRT